MSETTRTNAMMVALEVVALQNKQPTQESFIALAAAIDDFIVTGGVSVEAKTKPRLHVIGDERAADQ